ncbi:MAG: phosphonate ABC transporter ATP-binding protein [Candidatus Dormibacteraeota bacterium]|nr:phosphonate ABC transporter ATP-binding protein [Candidatus Dormibacteraeota bacterium]
MSDAAEVLFSLRGAGVRYGTQHALRDVDLEVRAGERVALVGPSGAGKSTLLSLLNASARPSSGTVRLLGHELATIRPRQLRALQARIGTIHQQFALVGPLRVIHNVNAGRLAHWSFARAAWSLLRPQETSAARAALQRVGVADKLFERTDQLSGGQQQRVAIARVLVQDPTAILADEPISSLDPARGGEVMALLRDLAVERQKTLVVSVHNFEYALSHCDRIIGLREGRVMFDLPADRVSPDDARALYRLDVFAERQ